jgi:hypothetical protein
VNPHAEVTTQSGDTSEYQLAGPVVQGLPGLNVDVVKHIAAFVEYKLSYANPEIDPKGGGDISIEAITHHLVFGLSVWF